MRSSVNCLLYFLVFDFSLFVSLCSFSRINCSSEPQTSSARFSICKCKYNFMSPHLGLCGFFRLKNFNIGSLLSKSQSFNRYSFFASVLVINECLSSLSLQLSQTQ
uniref:Putative secreted protein n=1 Tax=Xenopsylla cheopis TaxID=163159 RepID=A0A6M2DY85_XENCH